MKSQYIFPPPQEASRTAARDLEARVEAAVAKEGLFDRGDFVVAVSGGPDSVALALALKALGKRGILSGRMHVAHLNHHLRGRAAAADAAFVRRLARRLNAPFHLGERDVRALAKDRGMGIEEAARTARYDFFEKVMRDVGATRVALGHTATDNVETILQRILRGTGLSGLSGIPIRRPIRTGSRIEVVRPLLFCTRAEVLAYLRRQRVCFRQDATNVSKDYFRNRLRHELIPLLEARYNRRAQEALLRLGRIAAVEHAFVEGQAALWMRRIHPRRVRGELKVERAPLRGIPEALLPLAVRELLERAGAGLQPMTMEHYDLVAHLVRSRRSGQEIQLPGGISVHVSRGHLAIRRRRLPDSDGSERLPAVGVPLTVPGETRLPAGQLIRTQVEAGGIRWLRGFLDVKTPFEEMLDADKVAMPLRVRGLEKGVRFRPLGSPGTKKVSDLLTDLGVPRAERGGVLIVCDQTGPVWVVGMRLDDRVKVTRKTRRILKISHLRQD